MQKNRSEYLKQWHQRNKEVNNLRRKAHYEALTPDQKKARERKNRYKLTDIEFQQKLKEQKGVYAICEGPPLKGRNLGIDHCHNTGKIRGLLCFKCNVMLAPYENTSWREKADVYLQRYI